MPDARTHDLITVVTGVALAPIAFTVSVQRGVESGAALGYTALLVGAHLLSGIMFSPDLDIDSRIDDRWGIFFWIWRPYAWFVPHRHRLLSHGLVISQLLRLLYFYVVVVGLLAGLTWALGRLGLIVPNYYAQLTAWLLNLARDRPRETLAFLIGFCTGGAAHTIADWLVTGGKRYLHHMGIRVTRDYHDHDHWRPRAERYRARSWGD
jgi:uncharacterized metal-binding protein